MQDVAATNPVVRNVWNASPERRQRSLSGSMMRWCASLRMAAICICLAGVCQTCWSGDVCTVSGTQQVWQTTTVDVVGPTLSETHESPNPFLDFRLQILFTGPRGQQFQVPGFFAGDGNGGAQGNIWRVRFVPNQAGKWAYEVDFRHGDQIAVKLDPLSGTPVAGDKLSGTLNVAQRDPHAPGFRKWGRLEYVGSRYLKFANGPSWIRGGTDSPENFLAYAGFDNTPASHQFRAHRRHWRTGDPDWADGRGRAIIGAINYLADQHVNSIYFLTMNIGGDGQDVWPWAGTPDGNGSDNNDNLHFDVGKLRQWNIVFDHAQRRGIFLHFVLNEAETKNKRELDHGELKVERRLYYRELVARFGHHLALQWNLCEEYNLGFDLGADRIRQFADYLQAIDPYDHPITVHSAGDPLKALSFTFGDPRFSMTSVQLGHMRIDELTEAFLQATRQANRPLPISMDEFTVDVGTNQGHEPVDVPERHRKQKLWPTLLSGGMIEFILEDLLQTDRFDTPELEKLWQYTWYARKFLEQNTPFWDMETADQLVDGESTIEVGIGRKRKQRLGAQVLALPHRTYAVYLPAADGRGTLDLTHVEGTFTMRWYNPRNGQFEAPASTIEGGKQIEFGIPPRESGQDWAVLVQRKEMHR
jgi:hypothetical protein